MIFAVWGVIQSRNFSSCRGEEVLASQKHNGTREIHVFFLEKRIKSKQFGKFSWKLWILMRIWDYFWSQIWRELPEWELSFWEVKDEDYFRALAELYHFSCFFVFFSPKITFIQKTLVSHLLSLASQFTSKVFAKNELLPQHDFEFPNKCRIDITGPLTADECQKIHHFHRQSIRFQTHWL